MQRSVRAVPTGGPVGLAALLLALGACASVRGPDAPALHPHAPSAVGAQGRRSTASPSVSVLSDSFPVRQLGRTRRVWLYLPPDYATSRRRYPVLYLHDGQNVFDAATSFAGEWGVDEALDSLHALGDSGIIVVAVDNGGRKRLDEYSPWRNPKYGGGEGDRYLEFLVHTLKPYVDRHYRTRPGADNTGIGGASMGGLISLYAGLKYPGVFGRTLVFSPSLWFAPDIFPLARQARPGAHLYFVSGARESGTDDPGAATRDQGGMVAALKAAGFDVTQLRASVAEDGQHAEWFWRREFPAAYLWLFGRH